MRILSIGNSFSQDAQRYLNKIAERDSVDIQTVNLFIGGCSLETHHANLINNAPNYELEINGMSVGQKVSVCDMLKSDVWDYITLQQASKLSTNFDTYLPHIKVIADYIKNHCKKAKILIHQTWAYEEGSDKLHNDAGYKTSEGMLSDICKAYDNAFKTIKADGIIPCGRAMTELSKNHNVKAYRDGLL